MCGTFDISSCQGPYGAPFFICKKAGFSQASQLTKMMREFAEKIEAEK